MGIARLWLLGTGMLWVMCWSGHKAYGQQGVGLSRNSMDLTNNSIVTNTDIGTGTAALVCTTTYRPCCTSGNPETQWYFPDGNQVPNNPALPYQRTRGQNLGTLILSRNSESTITGIFHCDIPDVSGTTQSFYVGIYDMNTGTPTVTTLVYNEATRSLTCTSTGGPATTVTWRKDGTVITLNATYQQTQVVTNATTGTYETVLTTAQSVTDIFGTYSCTVENDRGTSAAINATVSSLQVSITPGANPTAGQSYTFACTITLQGGLTGTPTVQWRGPSSDPITGEDFTVSTTPPYTLTIDPLRQSYDGQYTCQATIGTTTGSSSATLAVAAPSVSVEITSADVAVLRQSYTLSCSVSGEDSLDPTSTTYRWYRESPMSIVATTSTYTINNVELSNAGQYTCEVVITSPYLNAPLSQRMMQDITVQIPVPVVSVLPEVASTTYAGSELTLSCSIVLNSTLFSILQDLAVTSVWSKSGGGMLSSVGHITVSPAAQGVLTTFISTVMFNTLQTSDAGTYTCAATVAPPELLETL